MSRPQLSHDPNDLAIEFLARNDHLHSGGDRNSALQRLVELAAQSVPGCDWAAVTEWPASRPPRSLAVSGEVAAAVDQLQYDLSTGLVWLQRWIPTWCRSMTWAPRPGG